MSYGETRTYLGRSQTKIHRINGEESWQDSIDARRTVREHAEEWAFTPFSAAQQTAARKDMPLTDRAQAVPSESHGPYSG
ncbi:hypothetical protein [Sinorhizobium meliloti]|uniref:hypothetical protein n=1 Tax=Rhizobium meliloti TaxID=382 RepID=UPI003F16AD4F